jgi:hypothetical protein
MKQKFTDTPHCQLKLHCKTCRSSKGFRESIQKNFEWDGECPLGFTEETAPSPPVSDVQRMPSVAKQAANLTEAVANVLTSLVRGGKVLADKETRDARIAICEQCPSLVNNRCVKCGCYTAAKVAIQTEKCPIEKW